MPLPPISDGFVRFIRMSTGKDGPFRLCRSENHGVDLAPCLTQRKAPEVRLAIRVGVIRPHPPHARKLGSGGAGMGCP